MTSLSPPLPPGTYILNNGPRKRGEGGRFTMGTHRQLKHWLSQMPGVVFTDKPEKADFVIVPEGVREPGRKLTRRNPSLQDPRRVFAMDQLPHVMRASSYETRSSARRKKGLMYTTKDAQGRPVQIPVPVNLEPSDQQYTQAIARLSDARTLVLPEADYAVLRRNLRGGPEPVVVPTVPSTYPAAGTGSTQRPAAVPVPMWTPLSTAPTGAGLPRPAPAIPLPQTPQSTVPQFSRAATAVPLPLSLSPQLTPPSSTSSAPLASFAPSAPPPPASAAVTPGLQQKLASTQALLDQLEPRATASPAPWAPSAPPAREVLTTALKPAPSPPWQELKAVYDQFMAQVADLRDQNLETLFFVNLDDDANSSLATEESYKIVPVIQGLQKLRVLLYREFAQTTSFAARLEAQRQLIQKQFETYWNKFSPQFLQALQDLMPQVWSTSVHADTRAVQALTALVWIEEALKRLDERNQRYVRDTLVPTLRQTKAGLTCPGRDEMFCAAENDSQSLFVLTSALYNALCRLKPPETKSTDSVVYETLCQAQEHTLATVCDIFNSFCVDGLGLSRSKLHCAATEPLCAVVWQVFTFLRKQTLELLQDEQKTRFGIQDALEALQRCASLQGKNYSDQGTLYHCFCQFLLRAEPGNLSKLADRNQAFFNLQSVVQTITIWNSSQKQLVYVVCAWVALFFSMANYCSGAENSGWLRYNGRGLGDFSVAAVARFLQKDYRSRDAEHNSLIPALKLDRSRPKRD